MQRLAKLLLIIHALVTLGYGIVLFARIEQISEYMGLQIISPDGQAELYTMYIGMSGIMSLFMLWGAFRPKWLMSALLFLLLSMTGITLGRIVSTLFLDTGSYIIKGIYYDVPLTLLTGLAYFRLSR